MADTNLGADLAQRLATTATGFAVVNNGVLDIATVSDTARKAALKGIGQNVSHMLGLIVATSCKDEDCDCFERKFAALAPSAKIVTVKVEVANG